MASHVPRTRGTCVQPIQTTIGGFNVSTRARGTFTHPIHQLDWGHLLLPMSEVFLSQPCEPPVPDMRFFFMHNLLSGGFSGNREAKVRKCDLSMFTSSDPDP